MDNDSVTLNELTPKLVNILTRYLQIRFGASIGYGRLCSNGIAERVKRIKENGIEKPESLLAYFLSSALAQAPLKEAFFISALWVPLLTPFQLKLP